MGDARPPGIPPEAEETVIPTARAMPTSLFQDRYRIERVIGTGAFGRVYLAFDTRLRRNVAVKELLASRNTTDHAMYERYLERFQREARATGTIQQRNVVVVYDLHVDAQGNNYLVMEYVDGTNLRDLLAQVGTLPVGRAVAVATDVAHALEAVHERAIVHRDVKPANIMITRRGAAKLMDFGIAQVGHESLRTRDASRHPGTPLYMSPEQAGGYGYIDGRSDLYALGLVLYEMLAGEPYPRRRQPLGAVRRDLPPHLVAVVERLTAREVDARYQSVSAALRDLEALDAAVAPARADDRPPPGAGRTLAVAPPPASTPPSYGVPSAQYPAGTPTYPPPYTLTPGYAPPPTPPRRNRKLLSWIGGALVAVIAVVAGFLLYSSGGDHGTATATVAPASVPTSAATVRPTIAATAPAIATVIRATVTRAPTATTVPATAPPTARPTVPPTSGASNLATWADPKGLVRLQYPTDWSVTKDAGVATNVLELDGPDGTFFFLDIYDPQTAANLTDEIADVRSSHTKDTTFTYTDGPVSDAVVGGEPAKTFLFTYAPKNKPGAATLSGKIWDVNRSGKEFLLTGNSNAAHNAEIDAIVASLAFLK